MITYIFSNIKDISLITCKVHIFYWERLIKCWQRYVKIKDVLYYGQGFLINRTINDWQEGNMGGCYNAGDETDKTPFIDFGDFGIFVVGDDWGRFF